MGALSNIDPTAVAVWASAVVLFALIAVLRAVFKLNFSLLTVLALGLGIALSLVFDGQVDSLNLLGNIYINLITALVAPLIFVSIISSITYVGSLKKLRSIGLRSVGWLLLTNLIAIVMTLGVAIPLHIGSGVKLVDDESTAGFLTSQTAPLDQVILNFFPKNIVGDLSGNRVVPIIITATVLAIAIVSVGRQKDVSIVKRFFEQTKGVIYKAVGYVVELTPYAVVVLGATSTAATTSKADALLALLSILVLGFVLNIIQAFVVNGLLLKFVAHVPPLTFFKAVLPAQATAFATQSSVATLPLSIRQLGTVGVGADVANFTTPIGTTIGMPGCAGVWPMLSAVFTINALGLGYSPVSYVALAVIGLLSSIGTAGVPGTAIVTATTVFTAVGLPVQLLVPLVPVSNIVGMPSTMANVSAAVTCSFRCVKRILKYKCLIRFCLHRFCCLQVDQRFIFSCTCFCTGVNLLKIIQNPVSRKCCFCQFPISRCCNCHLYISLFKPFQSFLHSWFQRCFKPVKITYNFQNLFYNL